MDLGTVCKRCDTLNALVAKQCERCGAPLQNPLEPAATAAPEIGPSMIVCPNCQTEVPESFRFCGNCGQKMQVAESPAEGVAKTLYFGAMQVPNLAKLILIKGEGLDGVAYHLNATEHIAGRDEGAILFPEDPILSPRHACFYYQDGHLHVRDEGSINGIFVRLTRPLSLVSGARFLIGEQLFQFDPCKEEELAHQADEDGTFFYSSPVRPSRFKLIQILRGGDIGMIFRASTDEVSLGREENDINFPDDPYISGRHATVSATPEGPTLTDLNSKNGTFYLINGPQRLAHGDYVFLGQQLMRVEIS